MNVDMVIQLINGVGFPIAACIAMAVFIVWDRKQRMNEQKDAEEKNKEMYDSLKEAINNNTSTINTLLMKLEGKLS